MREQEKNCQRDMERDTNSKKQWKTENSMGEKVTQQERGTNRQTDR